MKKGGEKGVRCAAGHAQGCAAPAAPPAPACALQVYHEIAEDSTEAGVVYIVAGTLT